MPILERLDIVETTAHGWADAQPPQSEDLVPNDFEYRLTPGDLLRIEVYELLREREMDVTVRQVDQSGNIRMPNIGDVPAAGRTLQQLQDEIEERLKPLIPKPNVSVSMDEQRSLQFTALGRLSGAGSFRLVRPDVRLLEALAITGGVPDTTHRIYVIRRVALSESVASPWEQRGSGSPASSGGPAPTSAVDIEALIRQLENSGGGSGGQSPTDQRPPEGTPGPGASPPPGMAVLRQDAPPPVDIDDLVPPATAAPTAPSVQPAAPPATQVPTRAQPIPQPRSGQEDFFYDPARNAWVRTSQAGAQPKTQGGATGAVGADLLDEPDGAGSSPLFAERVIVIPYRELITGDSRLNIVVRPNDLLYVQGFEFGFVYIDGEINRAGSYELPATGGLTLSRLVAAAGGLGGIAIPERVEVTRMIASSREATIRVNLAAIRRRTEPDMFLKPGDHINIGTNFFAVPLAVFRNGFRMTYGFGFLLDRNFGNDVFGPPPESFRVN
jgi:polysaccharide export outer membrane protein